MKHENLCMSMTLCPLQPPHVDFFTLKDESVHFLSTDASPYPSPCDSCDRL